MKLNLFLFFVFLGSTGCSTMMGEPRDDFDDSNGRGSATVGGVWPEKRYLDDDGVYNNEPYRFGHNDRTLASDDYGRDGYSWNDSGYRSPSSERENQEYRAYPPPSPPRRRVTRSDFIDKAQSTGSLWASDGQTNYFFTKNRVKSVGDIVSVSLEEQIIKDISAEVKRTLTSDERDVELQLAEESREKESANRELASAPNTEKKPETENEEKKPVTFENLDLSNSIALKPGEVMMAEIVDRYPNGNYKIMGSKNIPYRGGKRYMSFAGIVRASDINDSNDSVNSGKLYEYKLKIDR